MLHSAWLALIAAIGMVGLNQMMHSNDASLGVLDHIKIAIKTTVLAAILIIGYISIKRSHFATKAWGLMTLLAISNIVIAVFW